MQATHEIRLERASEKAMNLQQSNVNGRFPMKFQIIIWGRTISASQDKNYPVRPELCKR
jgi:hypothetical protein